MFLMVFLKVHSGGFATPRDAFFSGFSLFQKIIPLLFAFFLNLCGLYSLFLFRGITLRALRDTFLFLDFFYSESSLWRIHHLWRQLLSWREELL